MGISKEGDTVQDGDLWCGIDGDFPLPQLAISVGSRVSQVDEQYHRFMRLVEQDVKL